MPRVYKLIISKIASDYQHACTTISYLIKPEFTPVRNRVYETPFIQDTDLEMLLHSTFRQTERQRAPKESIYIRFPSLENHSIKKGENYKKKY